MNNTVSTYLSLKDAAKGNYVLVLDGYYRKSFEDGEMNCFHKHNRYEIMYVEDGECEILISDQPANSSKYERIILTRGSGIFINSTTWHKLIVKDKCVVINQEYLPKKVDNSPSFFKDLLNVSKEMVSFVDKFDKYALFTDNGKISWLMNTMIEEISNNKNASDFEKVFDMYSDLLFIEIARSSNNSGAILGCETHVKKAIQYINGHIKERIKSDDISNYVGVSYGYLEGLFKARLGVSLCDYIIEQKCKIAEKLLTSSSQRIADIATSVNFGSRQQFCSVFTKYSGISPMKYRVKMQDTQEDFAYGFNGLYAIDYVYKKEKITKNTI